MGKEEPPLEIDVEKPLTFGELMWMCEHFEIEKIENGVITFSGEVTVIEEKENDESNQTNG